MDVPIFAALQCGLTVDESGVSTPTVAIDASDTPAIADLARVHATEGIGDIWTEAARDGDLLLLGIKVTVPVTATFVIAFSVTDHAPFLAGVIDAGSLVIAHTDPERAVTERPQWLAVDIDGDALETHLDA